MTVPTEPDARLHLENARATRTALHVLVIAVFTLLCYGPLLRDPGGLLHWPHGYNDAVKQYLGSRILVGRTLHSGEPPYWDPHSFAGRPLLANPQAAVLYPGTWLFALAPSIGLFSWNLVLHVFMFALGTYALARTIGVPDVFAVLAGCFAAGSLYNAGHVLEGHLPHVSAAAWFPWILVAYYRLAEPVCPQRIAVGWLAVFGTMCLLAGHGQEAYYAALGLGMLFLIDAVWFFLRRLPGDLFRLFGALLVAALLALLLAAVQLLPQLTTLPDTVRGGNLALRDAWSFSSSLKNLVQLLFPFTLGCYTHDNYSGPWNYWEGNLGLGVALAVLAATGVMLGRRDRRIRKLAILGGFALWFALGKEGRLFELAYQVIPGVGLFRAPGRMLFWFATVVPVLAACGAWQLAQRAGTHGAARLQVSSFLAVAVGAVAAAVAPTTCGVSPLTLLTPWASGTTTSHGLVDGILVQVAVAAGLLVVAILVDGIWHAVATGPTVGRRIVAVVWFWVLAGAVTQVLAGMWHLVHVVSARNAVPGELARAVRSAMEACPERPCRVLAASGLLPDTAAVLAGLEKLTGYDAFQLRGFATALSLQGTGDPSYILRHYDRDPTAFPAILWSNDFLDAWGVHFVLAREEWVRSRMVSLAGWDVLPVRVHGPSGIVLLRRSRPVPRYRVRSEGPGASSAAVSQTGADPPTRGRWQFRVRTPEPAELEVAVPLAPGMVVYLDGRVVEPETNAHGCIVLPLPEGEHVVLLEYRPPFLTVGAIASAAGALLLARCLLPWRRRPIVRDQSRHGQQ